MIRLLIDNHAFTWLCALICIVQATIRADPTEIQFSEMKTDERSSIGETTVSSFLSKC